MTVDASGLLPIAKRPYVPTNVKTANYQTKAWELALFDATASSLIATLPVGAPVGTEVVIKRVDLANTNPTNTFTVSIVPAAGDTIRNGLVTNTSLPLTGQDQARLFVKETATQWTAVVDDPIPSLLPRFPQLLYSMTTIKAGDLLTAAGTNTVETAFASQYTVPANSLAVGQTLQMRGAGVFTQSTAGPSQTPRVRFGSSLLINVGALGLLANTASARYSFDCLFTVRSIGAAGTMEATGLLHFVSAASGQVTSFQAGPSGVGGETTNPVAINTTVDNMLRLSTQWSSNAAGNENQLRQLMVSSMRAPVGSS